MKSVSSRQIAMAFTGSFLGAGFVSGQELTQFFAAFGSFGFVGMVLSIALFCVLGCFVMILAKGKDIIEFDKVIVEKDIPLLRGMVGVVFIFFLFGVTVIMAAGAGALLYQMFGVPKIIGNALMVLLLTLVVCRGAKGVLTAFSIIVPLLIGVAVIVSILSFFAFPGEPISAAPVSQANPFLGNWLFATILFVSYNMMAAISILVPIAPDVAEDKTIQKGIFQGTVQLSIAFGCILLPLILHRTMLEGAELPMLALAQKIHPALGIVYGILLLCGMTGSGISCFFGVMVRLGKIKNLQGRTVIFMLSILIFIGSIAGFKGLVAILLPLCGYVGFVAMVGISFHFRSLQKERANG